MATNPTDLASISLTDVLAPELEQAFNRTAKALRYIKVVGADSQNGPFWANENDENMEVETYAEGADSSNYGSDEDFNATLAWARYRSRIQISDDALNQSRLSPTPLVSRDMFARKLVSHSEAVIKRLETDLFDGAGSNGLVGFDEAIDDSNSYAGVNRATEAYWRSTVNHNSGTPRAITKDLIRSTLDDVSVASGERPDIAFCHPYVFSKVAGLFDSEIRYVGGGATSLGTTASVNIEGTEFVRTAGDGYGDGGDSATIFLCNSSKMEIQAVPHVVGDFSDSMAFTNPSDLTIANFLNYHKLAKTGDATKGVVRVKCQLVVRKPIAFGKITDILL